MLNFSTNTPKNQLHQTFQISKILRYCYSEIVLIQPHCSTNTKPKIIFFIPTVTVRVFVFYFSLLSSLSSLTFLFLFPVASLFLSGSRFKLLPSKVCQSRTSKPKRLWSVAADMEVELDSGVI